MKIFARKPIQEEKTADRMARLMRAEYPTLLLWFDNTIMGLGSSFDRWRYHDGPMEEVTQHVEALSALMTELQHRKQA